MNGTYQVFATIEGEPEIQSSFFNIGHESDITPICPEPPNNIAVPTLLSVQAPSILKGDSSYGVKATIQNDSEEKTQNVMVLTALYDGNDKLVDYSSVHLEIASGEIGSLLPQLYVPANVNDYKVKIFVCEGNDIRYGSMMPLSLSKTIKNNMQPLVSDSELQESKLPSIELTENMEVLDTTRFLSETEAELSSISTIDDIDVDVTLSCNGVYCENVLKQGSDVKVDVSITNNRSSSIPLNYFFYVLKKVPSLLTFYDSCELTIEPGETREFSNTCALSQFDLSQYNSKISILGMGGGIDMQPAIPVIILSNDKQDFFGNDNDKATNVGIGRQIVGDINFLNDIDCIKFVPNETGYYVIQSYGNTNIKGALYNNNILIEESYDINSQNINFIIEKELIRGQTYYLKLSGENDTGEYGISINKANDIISIPENGTINVNMEYAGQVMWFKLTPTQSGIYNIISKSIIAENAELYSGTKELLLRKTNGWYDIYGNHQYGFIFDNYFYAGQEYYLKIYNSNGDTGEFSITTFKDDYASTIDSVNQSFTMPFSMEAIINQADDVDIVSFEPKLTGTYVVTAKSVKNVKGLVFDANKHLLYSDCSRDDVSFKISEDFIGGSKYYIAVVPKTKADVGNYTLYIENPFKIVSVTPTMID